MYRQPEPQKVYYPIGRSTPSRSIYGLESFKDQRSTGLHPVNDLRLHAKITDPRNARLRNHLHACNPRALQRLYNRVTIWHLCGLLASILLLIYASLLG